jgi:methylated-DNA-[protein]-cysteine S-methyltransferase
LWQTVRMLQWAVAECAAGVRLRFTASPVGLRAIDLRLDDPPMGEPASGNRLIAIAEEQMRAYFAGRLRHFELPLDPQGTEFQLSVWRELETIPFGEIRSYSQIAVAIGRPKAVRAVGAANGANPLPIVVPCHRVIGSSGKLVGYGGGLPLKHRLLELEGCSPTLFRL